MNIRKVAVWVVCLALVAVIGLVVSLPYVLSTEGYKQQVSKLARQATGRELTIEGDARLTVLPRIGVRLEKISLANAPGFKARHMMQADEIRAYVAFWPLLKGKIEISSLDIVQPKINLEINERGQNNWEFKAQPQATRISALEDESPLPSLIASAYAADTAKPAAIPARPSAAPAKPAAAPAPAPASNAQVVETPVKHNTAMTQEEKERMLESLKKIILTRLEVTDGVVDFDDRSGGRKLTLSQVNLAVAMPDVSSRMMMTGRARWNDRPVTLEFQLDSPESLLRGQQVRLVVGLDSEILDVDIKAGGIAKDINGRVNISTPSLLMLSKWAGQPIDWKGGTPLALSVKAELNCGEMRCSLKNGEYKLDDMLLKGEAGLSWSQDPVMIAGRLSAGELNLNPYLPQVKKQASSGSWLVSDAMAQAAAAPSSGWSNAPIDLSMFKLARMNIKVDAQSVKYQNFVLGKTELWVTNAPGKAMISFPSIALYGGTGNAKVTIDHGSKVPMYTKQVQLTGVEAEPLLTAAYGQTRLSGKLNANAAVTAMGYSQQQLVSTLAGKGQVQFIDGAIKGANIAGMVRDLKAVVSGAASGTTEKTDFSELAGTFTIANGIVSNNDLAMKAPLLRMTGAGTIDLPRRYLRYLMKPELVNTLKGQGGKDKEGLVVPIIVEGTVDQLTFRPDVKSAATEILKDPEKAKETVKNVKEQVKQNKGEIKNLIKGLR